MVADMSVGHHTTRRSRIPPHRQANRRYNPRSKIVRRHDAARGAGMAITPKLTTADELLLLPDDDFRHELVRGELRSTPPPGFEHGKLSNRLGRRLGPYVELHHLGE